MKKITISSVGSCNAITRLGSYDVLLEYNGKWRYLTRNLQDTTANRCIIQGLISAVEVLKEPCDVTLVTSTDIGLKLKGPNADIVRSLLRALEDRNCKYNFEVMIGQGDTLRRHIISQQRK